MNNSIVLLRFADLKKAGIVKDHTTLRRWIARRNFPKPVVLNAGRPLLKDSHGKDCPLVVGRRIAWRAADVEAWLQSRIQTDGHAA